MSLIDYVDGPKKRSSGEWKCQICPACGGREGGDRLTVWDIGDKGHPLGGFLCRKCGIHGSGKKYLHDYLGMTWTEAGEALGISTSFRPKTARRSGPCLSLAAAGEELAPEPMHPDLPSEAFRKAASAFLSYCQSHLEDAPARELLEARHIGLEAAREAGIGYNPGLSPQSRAKWGREEDGKTPLFYIPAGLVIAVRRWTDDYGRYSVDGGTPEVVAFQVRRTAPDEVERYGKYCEIDAPQARGHCYMTPPAQSPRAAFLVESALDAVLIWQELGREVTCVAALGAGKRIDLTALKALTRAQVTILAPDADAGGAAAWDYWHRTLLLRRAQYIPLVGGKDPGEMETLHEQGEEDAPSVRTWAELAIEIATERQKKS